MILSAMLVIAVGATPARAQDDDPAMVKSERLFRKGKRYFSVGQFENALKAYQAAYDAKPLPDFLFNIAQCYRNLGDYERAVEHYRDYLEQMPDAPNRGNVETTIRDLEREIAEQRGDLRPDRPPRPRRPGDGVDERDTPFYKKWQFWAGVAVVGAAGGTTSYFLLRDTAPDTDIGNLDFPK
jgi:tetratricopeptide (TPR) repeat protein